MARQEQWKGIWNDEAASLELYDLYQDPAEKVDVSSKEAEMTQVLSEAAEQWLRNCRARAVADEEAVDLDQETIDEFRALGYFN